MVWGGAHTLTFMVLVVVIVVQMDGWTASRRSHGNELGFLFRLPWLAELVILWGVGETRGLVSWVSERGIIELDRSIGVLFLPCA